jgi:hypothetical protein
MTIIIHRRLAVLTAKTLDELVRTLGEGIRTLYADLQLLADEVQSVSENVSENALGGNVVGPASSTDNALVRWDGTTGELVQNSNATLTDAGNLAVTGTATASNLSGTNTGDQTITLTGDVTGSGTGSFAATIADDAVTDAKLRNSGALSVVGRSANSTGSPADISATAASGQFLRESGSVLGFGTDLAGMFELSAESGITASTTQTQGQVPLTKTVNQFSTVANNGDAATMPTAVAGRVMVIVNDGANPLGLFPASGDDIESYGVNAVYTVATAARYVFFAIDATNWRLVNTVTGG